MSYTKDSIFIIGLVLSLFFLVTLVSSEVFEGYNTTPDASSSVTQTGWRGQNFRIGANGTGTTFTVGRVEMWFNVTDLGNYTILIQNNTGSAFQPNGQNVSYGVFIPASLGNTTTRLTLYNITMTPGILYAGFRFLIADVKLINKRINNEIKKSKGEKNESS